MATSGTIGFIVQDVPDAFRDRAHLRQWLYRVAQDHGTRIDAVSYVLMDDRALLKYNRDFLQHDDLTDVITFPVESNNGVSGDVLISYDRIRENASTFSTKCESRSASRESTRRYSPRFSGFTAPVSSMSE